MASAALVLGSLYALQSSATAGPSTAPSAVDYAQCANGTGSAVTCERGWINGILQKSNSHFSEGQVTPQRLEVAVPEGTGHTITLRYLARKGSTHAYDNLAQWDRTVTGADRCLGLNTTQRKGIGCELPTPGTPVTDSYPIPIDTTDVAPASNGSESTETHLPASLGDFKMYGGDITGVTDPVHDNAQGSGDDYATIVITYTTTGGYHNVQLLFGGHLAVGNPSRGGWGTGLGASSISGGPYHIKWDAADGASVGSRDNQIMGDAILDPLETSISTTPSVTTATVGSSTLASVVDRATLIGASTGATGTVTFSLYGPFSTAPTATSCVNPNPTADPPVAGNRLTTSTVNVVSRAATSTAVIMTGFSPGIYQWVASYSGDFDNAPTSGSCGDTTEQVTINQATPSGTSTQTLSDTVTVSGYNPTGTVSWYLYDGDSTCTDATKLVFSDTSGSNNTLVSGSATSGTFTPTPAAGGSTYYWRITYSGDTNNSSGTVEACGVQQVRVQNAPAAP